MLRRILPKHFPSYARAKRTLQNLRVSIICGLITFIVLRGTIGAGKFGTPSQDFNEIREHLPRLLSRSRVLAEAHEDVDNHQEQQQQQQQQSAAPLLIPQVRNWDALRAELNPNSTSASSKILLVTGSRPNPCKSAKGDHFLHRSLKNKADYCRLHGIDLFHNTENIESELSGDWAKLPLIRSLMLEHPEVEWIWWMDSDAVFTDMNFTLPLDRYATYNMVLHGWDELVYGLRSWTGLHTGSFLVRNTQWTLDLLDAWVVMGLEGRVRNVAGKVLSEVLPGRPDFEADDQSTLVFLLTTKREVWGNRVFLENAYDLNGFWEIFADKWDVERPFVTHFIGCKPCGGSVEKCLEQMGRALNYGDNQVQRRYGLGRTSAIRRKMGISGGASTEDDSLDGLKLKDVQMQHKQRQKQ